MANTNFQNQTTVIVADWLNDVNDTVYEILGDGTEAPATRQEVRVNLQLSTSGSDVLKGNGSGGIASAQPGIDYLSPDDIGVAVEAYNANIAKTDETQTFTSPQRGAVTTNNTLSFNVSLANNFKCTPTGTGALTFTNVVSGQSGYILLVNTSGYAITASATTKISSATLSSISISGTYLLSYFCDTTNVYITGSSSLS